MNKEHFDCASTPLQPGITLIDSSAGTGKTFAIATLVPRLLLEGLAEDITRILVVTFTNAAADELATRIRTRLRQVLSSLSEEHDEDGATRKKDDPYLASLHSRGETDRRRIAAALSRIDEIPVHTIHGFCKQALEEAAFESGLPLESEFTLNEETLLRQAVLDFWRQKIYPDSFLAHYVTGEQLTPESILEEYKQFRRYPGCHLLPSARPVQEVARRAGELGQELLASWNPDEVLALLAALPSLSQSKDKKEALALRNPQKLLGAARQARDAENLAAFLLAIAPLAADTVCAALKSTKERETFVAPGLCLQVSAAMQEFSALRHALRAEAFTAITAALDTEKRRLNIMSFHDLLTRLWEVLGNPIRGPILAASLKKRYQVALIDEFQDTDPLQLAIFTRIFAHPQPLFFIGDPKQAIYSFRGADIFAYLDAARHADRRHTLDKNWRSEEGAVEAVNALFLRRPEPFIFPEITFPPATAQGRDEVRSLHDPERKFCHWLTLPPSEDGHQHSKENASVLVLRGLQTEVLRLLQGSARIGTQRLRPSDIAILVRTNRQAQTVQTALRAVGIPAVIGGSGSILHSEEFDAVVLLLRFIARQEGSAALGGILWGMTAEDIFALTTSDANWNALCADLGRYRRLWENNGATALLQQFWKEKDVIARLLVRPDGDRKLTNLRHVQQILQEGPQAPEALLQWLQRRRSQPQDDRDELRLETDAQAAQIVTIHKSKGLEYPIVFCPFLWDARSPRGRIPVVAHLPQTAEGGEAGTVFDCGSTEYATNQARAAKETLSEDLRLLYVALTRAVHRIYISWGDVAKCENSALGWLLQSPASGIDHPEDGIAALLREHPDLMSAAPQEQAEPSLQRFEKGREDEETVLGMARYFPADRVLRSWDTSSFSSLTYGTYQTGYSPESLEDNATDDLGLPVTTIKRVDASAPGRAKITGEPFYGFGRGREAPPANETGNCLHEILERYCRANAAGDNTPAGQPWRPDQELLAQSLNAYGLQNPSAHEGIANPLLAALGMFSRLFNAPLPGSDIRLGEVNDCLAEMPFTLPLRGNDLSEALKVYFAYDATYSRMIAALPQRRVSGYLTGIIDLVFRHKDRWYIIDWKSNYLGAEQSAYHPGALMEAMREHHYILQYTLYAVALRRYLTQRIANFDFARDFGGVYYAFLRGIDDAAGGWYFDRPDCTRLQNLQEAFH